jgi:2-polyprenyl-6-methoxyphenol hydroxylase-like FAD-dependent oxidoreductase
MSGRTDPPVVVIGAGPTGLALALCLARRGVASTIVERRDGLSSHPRAHYVNTRSMELFRQWGIFDEVLAHSYPLDHLPFDQLTLLGGPTCDELATWSPARVTSCAQDIIEAALYHRLQTTGLCDVRWGVTVTDVADRGDAVAVAGTGPEGAVRFEGRWCVAADGAGSIVRRQLGIEMLGDPDLGSRINIYFYAWLGPEGEVPSLARMNANGGAFISMDGATRWCYHHPYDPAAETVAAFELDRCAQIVREAADLAPDAAVDVRAVRPWTMTALVADRMRVGNIILAGDAAHAFPPTGGFGMNSGMQDGHNLAWKLVALLDGSAGDVLLDSFEAERQPVAYLNTAQSLRNANRGVGAAKESPAAAEIEDRATKSVRSMVAVTEDPAEKGNLEMLEHAGAIGQDIGFAYDRSPVVTYDDVPRPDIHISRYVPNASPGARAPHLVVTDGDGTDSLIDLFDGRFTLVVARSGEPWRRAADSLGEITVVSVGTGLDVEPVEGSFTELYGIDDQGAVLVRPDGHVAFRAATAGDDPTSALAAAYHRALGVAPATVT